MLHIELLLVCHKFSLDGCSLHAEVLLKHCLLQCLSILQLLHVCSTGRISSDQGP